MKKLILFVAVATAVAMASCSGATKAADESADTVKAKIENCTNPDSLDRKSVV